MKTFPILHPPKYLNKTMVVSVPWEFVEQARTRIELNHSQTLERLAERGGLDFYELLCGLQNKNLSYKQKINYDECIKQMEDLISNWKEKLMPATKPNNPVIQEWVQQLSFMQQSVLLTAIRGPDGLPKEHISKKFIKWIRRCVLYSAFDSKLHNKPIILDTPYNPSGGGFTGPSLPETCIDWEVPMFDVLKKYLQETDSMPHHFQMHVMHASEIIGYCHPNETIRKWWNSAYITIVKTMHLTPESYETMMKRLGDSEDTWKAMDTAHSTLSKP